MPVLVSSRSLKSLKPNIPVNKSEVLICPFDVFFSPPLHASDLRNLQIKWSPIMTFFTNTIKVYLSLYLDAGNKTWQHIKYTPTSFLSCGLYQLSYRLEFWSNQMIGKNTYPSITGQDNKCSELTWDAVEEAP